MKNYLPIIMGVFLVSSFSVSIPAYAQNDETYNPKTDISKLRDDADAISKNIGICLPSNIFNYPGGNEAILAYGTFNMVVAENEMKMDAYDSAY